MNTNNSTDVAGFFTDKLKNATVEPPVTLWENVKNGIPAYPKRFGHWYVYLSVFLTIIAFTWLGINKLQHEQKVKAKQIQYKQVVLNDTHVVKNNNPASNQSVIVQNKNKNTVAYQSNKENKSSETSIYQLEAAVYPSLAKVEFVDSTNTVKQTVSNPVINEFGYYVIDISTLKHGKYIINIYSKDGKKYSKQERLR
jgi:hypothetical protein